MSAQLVVKHNVSYSIVIIVATAALLVLLFFPFILFFMQGTGSALVGASIIVAIVVTFGNLWWSFHKGIW